jgi:hypothetical protein
VELGGGAAAEAAAAALVAVVPDAAAGAAEESTATEEPEAPGVAAAWPTAAGLRGAAACGAAQQHGSGPRRWTPSRRPVRPLDSVGR